MADPKTSIVIDNKTLEEAVKGIQNLLEENKNIFGEDISGEIKRSERLLDRKFKVTNPRLSEMEREKLKHKLLQRLIKKGKLNIWIERIEDYVVEQESDIYWENDFPSPVDEFNEIIQKLRRESNDDG